MQQVNQSNAQAMVSNSTSGILNVAQIPALKHAEAPILAKVELEHFITLAETIQGNEWQRPTACTLWNVQQIVAHQADHCHNGIGGFRGFVRDARARDLSPYKQKGMNRLDSTNQYEIDRRADRTPAQLIAEMREFGPCAIEGRDKTTWVARTLIRVSFPIAGWRPFIGYLFDILLTRDMWMHRLDICRATGHEMMLTAEHDGKLIALIMRDLGRYLQPKLKDKSVVFDLTGTGGGYWRVGTNPQPAATIHMDVLEFCVLNSARTTTQQVLEKRLVSIDGDHDFGRFVLENSLVLY